MSGVQGTALRGTWDAPSTSGRSPCCPSVAVGRLAGRRHHSAAAAAAAAAAGGAPPRRGSCRAGKRARLVQTAAASSPPFSPDTFRDSAGNVAAAGEAAVGVERVGVLVLNLGGPDTLDDVQPFLYNLFADPDIIRLPPAFKFAQPLIAQLISIVRAPKSRAGYEAIGGGSPLRDITQHQADALAAALCAKGLDARAYVAMRYWRPFTEEAVECIKQDGITKLVVLPLYPQFSVSTSGSSLRLLEKLLKEDPVLRQVKHVVIPSWYQRPGYVSAMATLIVGQLAKFARPDEAEVFFSAHGVPKSYVDDGDPYKEEMEHCIQLIMAELRRRGVTNSHTLAYQSRVGPVEWLQPYTDDSIRHLAQQGIKSLVAVPISFVSEHIETLEEIDMEYRELAEECGIKNWARVPALNTDPTFIDDLADAVVEALPYAGTMAGSSTIDALVPLGEVEALLETYDSQRKVLPPPIVDWTPGWTLSAEAWNGRIAILALVLVLLLELSTGRGVITNVLAL